MKQCLGCKFRLFFTPLPSDVYICCLAHNESAKDINLKTGVSDAIFKHGLKNALCKRWAAGKSICEPDKRNPFLIHHERVQGEAYLLKLLLNP